MNFIKYLGIDWGEKRIGLALADSQSKLAVPIGVVLNMEAVLEIIKKEEIDKVILGEPIKMSGRKDNFTKGFDDFLKNLKEKSGLPIGLMDERLTSKAADALAGSKKTKAPRDAVAAMLILQSYLDYAIYSI